MKRMCTQYLGQKWVPSWAGLSWSSTNLAERCSDTARDLRDFYVTAWCLVKASCDAGMLVWGRGGWGVRGGGKKITYSKTLVFNISKWRAHFFVSYEKMNITHARIIRSEYAGFFAHSYWINPQAAIHRLHSFIHLSKGSFHHPALHCGHFSAWHCDKSWNFTLIIRRIAWLTLVLVALACIARVRRGWRRDIGREWKVNLSPFRLYTC